MLHQRPNFHSKAVVLAAMLAVLSPAASFADQHDQRAQIAQATEAFQDLFIAGDFLTMMQALPPRLMDAVVAQSGLPRDEAAQALAQQSAAAMEGISILEINMDVENATIGTENGLTYALIPTLTILLGENGNQMRTESTTLGLFENGQWSLSRIASEQQEIAMKTLYREIANVTFPPMSQEVVSQ